MTSVPVATRAADLERQRAQAHARRRRCDMTRKRTRALGCRQVQSVKSVATAAAWHVARDKGLGAMLAEARGLF
jgi:hypothetical protein